MDMSPSNMFRYKTNIYGILLFISVYYIRNLYSLIIFRTKIFNVRFHGILNPLIGQL